MTVGVVANVFSDVDVVWNVESVFDVDVVANDVAVSDVDVAGNVLTDFNVDVVAISDVNVDVDGNVVLSFFIVDVLWIAIIDGSDVDASNDLFLFGFSKNGSDVVVVVAIGVDLNDVGFKDVVVVVVVIGVKDVFGVGFGDVGVNAVVVVGFDDVVVVVVGFKGVVVVFGFDDVLSVGSVILWAVLICFRVSSLELKDARQVIHS